MDISPVTNIVSILVLILCAIPLTRRFSNFLYIKEMLSDDSDSDNTLALVELERDKIQLYLHIFFYVILTLLIFFYW
jgi:hypothetical protein